MDDVEFDDLMKRIDEVNDQLAVVIWKYNTLKEEVLKTLEGIKKELNEGTDPGIFLVDTHNRLIDVMRIIYSEDKGPNIDNLNSKL